MYLKYMRFLRTLWCCKKFGRIALVAAAAAMVGACTALAPRETSDEAGFAPGPDRPAVTAQRRMVASAHPLASRVGLDILRRGGGAIDAAVAMAAVLTLVEPQSSGIGGGGFLMHFDGRTGEIAAYEGREAAPAATREIDFLEADGTVMARERYRVGGISVAVPGALRMLELAQARHGRLSWAGLWAPAIRLARVGFLVSPRLHRSIAGDRYLAGNAAARAYFFDAEGNPLATGALRRNPALAETLAAIAEDGADAFYRGSVARDIAAAVAADPRAGKMTASDLAGYRVRERARLCRPYRVWLVCGFGPPTAGGITTLMMLAMLERFDMAALAPNSPEAVHLFAEAARLANADRLRYVADPDFVEVPSTGLLDGDYLARRAALIRAGRALAEVAPGTPPGTERRTLLHGSSDDREQPSTTHLSVIDADGNAVALTASVGGAFGSRIMVRGFMLNNHATDFSAVPRTAGGRPKVNRPEAGKRPRSAQSPTFVFDGSGRLVLALGSPGGPRIIAHVVKTILGVLDWKLDVQAAIALPNRAVRGDVVELEADTPLADVADALRAMGHEVRLRPMTSGLQGIAVSEGVLTGGADPRREGIAMGD